MSSAVTILGKTNTGGQNNWLIYICKQLKYIFEKYEYFGKTNVQKTREITAKPSDIKYSYCQTEHHRMGNITSLMQHHPPLYSKHFGKKNYSLYTKILQRLCNETSIPNSTTNRPLSRLQHSKMWHHTVCKTASKIHFQDNLNSIIFLKSAIFILIAMKSLNLNCLPYLCTTNIFIQSFLNIIMYIIHCSIKFWKYYCFITV